MLCLTRLVGSSPTSPTTLNLLLYLTRMSPKKLGKSFLCGLLEWQVKRLRGKHEFKIVAVSGSVGKTSTKFVIAGALSGSRRVLYQKGNYNDRLTVPLVLFGRTEPGIFNIFAWGKILIANEQKLRQPFAYDVVVLELGTDSPGQMRKFAYLKPEISVVTAIAAEHMLFFGTLDRVAREELAPLDFAEKIILNIDDTPNEFLPGKTAYTSYGARPGADYRVISRSTKSLDSQHIVCELPDGQKTELSIRLLGAQGAKSAAAALAVTQSLGLPLESTASNLAKINPVAGRLNLLSGKNGSTIIDDTYNASPVAVLAALEILQSAEAPQRVAILGSMNELGDNSEAEHKRVGAACDPDKLDLVVTIGADAAKYLAPAAQQRGCSVKSFDNPYKAGDHVLKQLKPGTLVLAKGSQNGVFAEEALKPLLVKPSDASKLVRQTSYWLEQKRRQFDKA